MEKIAFFFAHPIQAHKKYHTKFLIGEVIILYIINLIFGFFYKDEAYDLENGEELIESAYKLSDKGDFVLYHIPALLIFIILIWILIIVYVRDKKSNPIKAKKLVKQLFIFSIVALVIDLAFLVFLREEITLYHSGDFLRIHFHTISLIISVISAGLIVFDIHVWRSEFGLEKFYGQPTSPYR